MVFVVQGVVLGGEYANVFFPGHYFTCNVQDGVQDGRQYTLEVIKQFLFHIE